MHRFGFLQKLLASVLRVTVGLITHVATHENVVALTFDDGPHPKFTPQLLKILEKYHAHATFFMVGQAAQRYPEVVQQVAQAGHAIGNHSWDHPSFFLIDRREQRAQIQACAQAIAPYGQRIFRPPFGHLSFSSRFDILMLRYKMIAWNLYVSDWLDQDGILMAESLINSTRPGSIILLHDAIHNPTEGIMFDRDAMLVAVDLLLQRLGDQMRFVTVPELLKHGRPQRENWYRKHSQNLY